MNVLGLCAGVAGLDLGVRLVLPSARGVCYVEREVYAASVLVARMAEGALDPAPVWTDLRTFDGRPWRGVVDLVTAGYPCQPYSIAGERRGELDPRDLWPDVLRVVRDVAPPLVFLENVAAHAGPGGGFFERVVPDLERAGYRVAADIVAAEEAPASHQRRRMFALAYSERAEWRPHREQPGGAAADDEEAARRARGGSAELADACGAGREGCERGAGQSEGSAAHGSAAELRRAPLADAEGVTRGDDAGQWRPGSAAPESRGAGPVAAVADADGDAVRVESERHQRQGRRTREAERRHALARIPLPLIPPGPDDIDAWAQVLDRVPEAEPAVCGMAHGMAGRVDRLRAIGNGVHPVAAGMAFLALWTELGVG